MIDTRKREIVRLIDKKSKLSPKEYYDKLNVLLDWKHESDKILVQKLIDLL